MKILNHHKLIQLVFLLALVSCKKDDPEPTPAPNPSPTPACYSTKVEVNTDINTPTVWKACTVYVVTPIQISINSTLTIEPGAIVKFKESVGDNAILISNSGRLIANGTSNNPIIFTSYKDDANGGDTNGDGNSTAPARNDWGGIIINNNVTAFNFCKFLYGGEGPGTNYGQPSLEFSYYYGSVESCTFVSCGGETSYAGYGVVDARYCENNAFVIKNCVFYDCIKPLFLNPFISVDASNRFHNPSNPSQKNQLNGIFMTSTSNEPTSDVSWLEDEVPFVLTGSFYLGDGKKLILGNNVIIKMALLPAVGYNKISIKEGVSFIQGYNLPGVFFTSYTDDAHGGDTNGDGNGSVPASGDWYGIQDISATITTSNSCYPWSNIEYAAWP